MAWYWRSPSTRLRTTARVGDLKRRGAKAGVFRAPWVAFCQCSGSGCVRFACQQGDFAEIISRLQCLQYHQPARAADCMLDLACLDEVHGVARTAFDINDVAGSIRLHLQTAGHIFE